jgi:hypothetical protein
MERGNIKLGDLKGGNIVNLYKSPQELAIEMLTILVVFH